MGRPVTQWQILAKDPERLADFYGRLFAWKVSADNPLNYRRADTGSATDQACSGRIARPKRMPRR